MEWKETGMEGRVGGYGSYGKERSPAMEECRSMDRREETRHEREGTVDKRMESNHSSTASMKEDRSSLCKLKSKPLREEMTRKGMEWRERERGSRSFGLDRIIGRYRLGWGQNLCCHRSQKTLMVDIGREGVEWIGGESRGEGDGGWKGKGSPQLGQE